MFHYEGFLRKKGRKIQIRMLESNSSSRGTSKTMYVISFTFIITGFFAKSFLALCNINMGQALGGVADVFSFFSVHIKNYYSVEMYIHRESEKS